MSVYKEDVYSALHSGWDDFEDALQAQVATRYGMNIILTRNTKDFQELKKIKVLTPKEYIAEE